MSSANAFTISTLPSRGWQWFLLLLLGLTTGSVQAQVPTFAEDIAPIIYRSCTPCHNPSGVGSFMPLTSYQTVSRHGMNIMNATITKHMPPWPPDNTYSRHLRDRSLSQLQINKIADWVNNSMPRGDTTLEPPAPVYNANTAVLGPPDTVVAMSQKWVHRAGTDNYRIFVIPLNLRENKDVAAVEFVPGNPNIAHHAIVAMDTTQQAFALDQRDPDYGYPSTGGGFGFSTTELNWATWVPGSMPLVYPIGVGKRLYKKSVLLVQMHYGPTPTAQEDSSFLRIYYARQPIRREMKTILMSPLNITNGMFFIPANTVRTFDARMTAPSDMSLIDVTPHAHLLCTSWRSYAVRGPGDTLKLIRIPKYDFHWQGTYTFPTFQRITQGTPIFGHATYDNTVNNPNNPSRPPVNASWGEQTTNEMFLLGFSYVNYEPGDENISLENTLVNLPASATHFERLDIYPNPAKDLIKLRFELREPTVVHAALYDITGKHVGDVLNKTQLAAGSHDLLQHLLSTNPGVYWLHLSDGKGRLVKKVVVE